MTGSYSAEEQRFAALRACGILNTAPEPAFDAIAARAARAARVGFAAIALHDGRRLWLKAACGAGRREISAQDATIANDILYSDGLCWFSNLAKHPKHRTHALVVGPPYIRFCAGWPLKLSTGEKVGLLYVIGLEPRRRSLRLARELEEFAAIATALIDARRAAALKEESERLLATFIDGSPAALAMFDRDMRYLSASPKWLSDYGLGGADIIGLSHYKVFPEISEEWKAVHRRCIAGATERCARDRFVRTDGSEQWLSWEVRPWRDAAGEIGGLVMLTRDLTREVKATLELERTSERLKRALEIGRMFFWEYDLRDGKVFVDGDVPSVVGRPSDPEVFNSDTYDSVHPDDRAGVQENWTQCIEHGVPYFSEHRSFETNGGARWVVAMGEAKRDEAGAIIGAVGMVQDISARKEVELQLQAARDLAESANRSKSELLATISHEMRTPLNGVLGLAHALGQSKLHPVQRELLDGILRSGDTLLALLNDILDSARIEAGQLHLAEEEFCLDDVLADITALYKERAETKGISFAVSCEDVRGRWRGDPLRIRQVLLNLIGNAVKFTLKGSVNVRITRQAAGPTCDRLSFFVRDTGIGFDEETRARLFNRFSQGTRETARRFGGTGLGLAICRGLVDLMGGEIDCSSTPGQGSEFWFSAPFPRAGQSAQAAEDEAAAQTGDGLRLRVLCVDDHPVNRQVLAQTLGHFGCVATFAENGEEALAAWDREAFDLIIMDILMPVLNGFEAAKAIRAREAEAGRARTPILALSANAGADQAAACRAAGMDGHIAKPFRPRLLAAAMREALGNTPGTDTPHKAR